MECAEVIKIGKEIDNLVSTKQADHAGVLDMLKTLQTLPVSLDILLKTRIGLIVNNLRRQSTQEEVICLCKVLIKTWKKCLPAETNIHKESSSTTTSSSGEPSSTQTSGKRTVLRTWTGDSKPEAAGTIQSATATTADSGKENKSSSSSSGVAVDIPQLVDGVSQTDDPVRLKCQELLENALKSEMLEDRSGLELEDVAVMVDAPDSQKPPEVQELLTPSQSIFPTLSDPVHTFTPHSRRHLKRKRQHSTHPNKDYMKVYFKSAIKFYQTKTAFIRKKAELEVKMAHDEALLREKQLRKADLEIEFLEQQIQKAKMSEAK